MGDRDGEGGTEKANSTRRWVVGHESTGAGEENDLFESAAVMLVGKKMTDSSEQQSCSVAS
jgi:hypothetical protein